MQQKLYEDSPYIVTAYTTTGEAVRSDRFACFQPQPDPGGVWLVQYGAHNYSQLRPADQAGNCDGVASALKPTGVTSSSDSGGSSTGLVVGGVVLVVLVAGGVLLMLRRRTTAGSRE
jgi:peptide/nickel transport system substrate-binding protein